MSSVTARVPADQTDMNDSRDRIKEKLVRVYAAHDELEAQYLQGALAAAGIESVIQDKYYPGLYSIGGTLFTPRELLVFESDKEQAESILGELENDNDGEVGAEE